MANASNTTAPTQFIDTKLEKYAYRRCGKGNGLPLLCLQHFTGTLDNWDPAVTDPLAVGRNPLVMKEMAKHVPDAGSYAPVTILVDEREDGVHLSYDRMVSFLAPYENREALAIAHDLDHKIEKLINDAAVE